MIQDNDNTEDFSAEVSVPFDANYAIMEASAWKICRLEFADDEVTQIIAVQQRTRTPSRNGTVKWICKIRTERAT